MKGVPGLRRYATGMISGGLSEGLIPRSPQEARRAASAKHLMPAVRTHPVEA